MAKTQAGFTKFGDVVQEVSDDSKDPMKQMLEDQEKIRQKLADSESTAKKLKKVLVEITKIDFTKFKTTFDQLKEILISMEDNMRKFSEYLHQALEDSTGLRNNLQDSGVGGRADGSHAAGAWRIPFDGYRGILHKDEMVLTAKSAALLRQLVLNFASGSTNFAQPVTAGAGTTNITVGVNIENVGSDVDVDNLAYQIAYKIKNEVFV